MEDNRIGPPHIPIPLEEQPVLTEVSERFRNKYPDAIRVHGEKAILKHTTRVRAFLHKYHHDEPVLLNMLGKREKARILDWITARPPSVDCFAKVVYPYGDSTNMPRSQPVSLLFRAGEAGEGAIFIALVDAGANTIEVRTNKGESLYNNRTLFETTCNLWHSTDILNMWLIHGWPLPKQLFDRVVENQLTERIEGVGRKWWNDGYLPATLAAWLLEHGEANVKKRLHIENVFLSKESYFLSYAENLWSMFESGQNPFLDPQSDLKPPPLKQRPELILQIFWVIGKLGEAMQPRYWPGKGGEALRCYAFSQLPVFEQQALARDFIAQARQDSDIKERSVGSWQARVAASPSINNLLSQY